MASSPSPFIFPTSAPAYVPTDVFSPSPFGYDAPEFGFFPASAYGSSSFPSATTYQYHQSFPSFHSAPPAFPYAAASPTPMSDFPPSQLHGPSIFPYSATCQIGPNQSREAPIPIHGDLHHTSFVFPIQATPQPNAAPPASNQEHRPPEHHAYTPTSTTCAKSFTFPSTTTFSTPVPGSVLFSPPPPVVSQTTALLRPSDQVPWAPTSPVHKHMGPKVPSMANTGPNHRLVEAETQSRFDSLHAAMSKLSTSVSQLAVAMGLQTTKSLVTGSSPVVASTAYKLPATTTSISSGTTAATVSSVSSLRPSDASTTAYEAPQMLSEMPQSYGLHNLIRQSVFLADGTERSYFTLPADYPLEQATSPMSHSESESVCVAAPPSVAARAASLSPFPCSKVNKPDGYESLLVHDVQPPTYVQDDPNGLKEMHVSNVSDKETLEIEQLLKCFSKAPKTEQTNACLYYAFDQQQNDETASVNVQLLRDPPLKMWVTHERRKEWDPGALAFLLMIPIKNGGNKDTIGNEHVERLSIVLPGVFTEVMLDIPPAKPPERHSRADSSLRSLLKAENLSAHTHFNLLSCNGVLKTEYCRIRCVWKFSIRQATRLKWDPGVPINLHASAPCSKSTSAAKHSLLLSSGGNSRRNHSILKLMQSLCASTSLQVTKMRHLPESLLMAKVLQNMSEFRDVQLTYMPRSPTINSAEFLRHMVTVLSCWLSLSGNKSTLQWDPGIAISSCMYSCLEMTAVKTLTWLQKSLLNYLQCQYPRNNTPCSEDTFLHQQGVQENYNAKHLMLSSEDYSKIRGMYIIFLTFLPP